MGAILSYFFYLFPVFAQTHRFTIEIRNVRPGKGSVVVAVFEKSSDFLKHPSQSKIFPANAATIKAAFTTDKDACAVAVYQDYNNNEKLDKNFLGIPKEPYGFSNNARPLFSAPGFEACRMNITVNATHVIMLN